ncbi:hypothetical protein HKBW3S09_00984 [Candidatus Hakubella thermalkaliphila]|uniref:Uncharacterized protein n=1 Tax=Candidatus Hakubella thermalkaliphila TaxID=2754717 RepID=A0A6V8NTS0_9ACTN|nr:hypothetical protein [Candidatus Hakubella thermalkaliphila]GFP23517.1 hypothetical protein HKBW3S09_00984 [Candidatus Hakubella thermalkaliphila]
MSTSKERSLKKKAVKLLGPELVKLLDEEKRFILKDIGWGLSDE